MTTSSRPAPVRRLIGALAALLVALGTLLATTAPAAADDTTPAATPTATPTPTPEPTADSPADPTVPSEPAAPSDSAGSSDPAVTAEPQLTAEPTPSAAAASTPDTTPTAQAQADREPVLFLGQTDMAVWDVARIGISGTAYDFEPGSLVTVAVNGSPVGELNADNEGTLSFTFTGEVDPGVYTISVSDGTLTASAEQTVVADEDYFGRTNPSVSMNRLVLSESDLAAAPQEIFLEDFADEAAVDIALNDEVLETVEVDSIGNLTYELTGPLAPGHYTLTGQHPAGSASVEFDVVADEQGTPAPAGNFVGTTVQTHASSDLLDEPEERPVSFQIDEAGVVSGLTGEYWWACVTGGYHGSGFSNFEEDPMPATPITVGQPFEIVWEGTAMTYTFYGVVNADGTGSGTIWASLGVCGSSILEWSAAGDGDYNPEPEPTEPEPTEAEPTEPQPEPTEPEPTEPAPTEPEPSEPGEDDVTTPGEAPSIDDLDPAAEGGITTEAEVRRGQSIAVSMPDVAAGTEVGVWLFSDPTYLGTHTVSDAGTVEVTVPARTSLGGHQLAAWSRDGLLGWNTVQVVPDPVEEPAPSEPGEPAPSEPAPGEPAPGEPGPGDDKLPNTGAGDLIGVLAAGAALLALGGAVLARRK